MRATAVDDTWLDDTWLDDTWLDDLAPAERARLVHVDLIGGRVTLRHPLIGSAPVELSASGERRRAHGALADVLVDEPERCAWHLAEAVVGPDARAADLLESASQRARRKGDVVSAVDALLQAAALTPAGPDRARRLAEAAFVGADTTGSWAGSRNCCSRRAPPLRRRVGPSRSRWPPPPTCSTARGTSRPRTSCSCGPSSTRSAPAPPPRRSRTPCTPFCSCATSAAATSSGPPSTAPSARCSPTSLRSWPCPAPRSSTPSARALPCSTGSTTSSRRPTPRSIPPASSGSASPPSPPIGSPTAVRPCAGWSRTGGGVARSPPRSTPWGCCATRRSTAVAGREAQQTADEGTRWGEDLGYRLISLPGVYCSALLAAARGTTRPRALAADLVAWSVPRGVHLFEDFASRVRGLAALGRGDVEQAYRQLTAASETFRVLGARLWATRADDELRATGLPRRSTPDAPDGALTAQEHRVAMLAASGLSNKQIAGRLYLSPRTVGAHLYRVFPKLGTTSRAAGHVAARRPRVQVSRAEQEAVVQRFLAAVRGGDLQGLLDVLAPDVVVVSDGGGVVAAARRPIVGADRVGVLLSGLATVADHFEAMPMWVNGAPAGRFDLHGALDTVASLVIEDGRITRIYAVRNPHKLARLDEETELRR